MRAEVGDELTVKGRHQGDEDRHGEMASCAYSVFVQDAVQPGLLPDAEAELIK